MTDPFDEDPDDPLALPFPPHTLLLEPATDLPRDRPSLVLRLLRQQLAELGLNLRLRECNGESFELEGFRVQLVCAPFWAEELAVPPQPWRHPRRSSGRSAEPSPGRLPHLLLGAWVEEECGAVRVPGVLTAAELRRRWPGFPEADPPPTLPLAAFQGGLDRLWLLVRLLSPDALLPPAAAAVPVAVRLRDWLEGVLAEPLVALGAELLPASAGAFRSPAAAEPAALASVVIPLALVRGRIESGAARAGASERFRLLLQLCGAAQGAQWLEVRLEPELCGDLLPQRLTLRVGERAIDTGGDGGSGPLSLTVMAGEEAIAIGLWHGDGSQLALPPLHFGATLGEPEPGSTG
ncbi:MAG: hypothetical protein ACKOCI_06835 [Cyanobium sp.]